MKAVKALAIVLLAVFCVNAVSAQPRHHYKHHVAKKYHKRHHYKHHVAKKYHKR